MPTEMQYSQQVQYLTTVIIIIIIVIVVVVVPKASEMSDTERALSRRSPEENAFHH
jgi:uncharacterized membrane protein